MNDITTKQAPKTLAETAQRVDAVVKQYLLQHYRQQLTHNSNRSQAADLQKWAEYVHLINPNLPQQNWQDTIGCWQGVTDGLVIAFKAWLLAKGQAIASVNRALSTVKIYCKIAVQADVIPSEMGSKIALVRGLRDKEGRNIDAQREKKRVSQKKADWVRLTSTHRKQLLDNLPDTPQGRRDRVLLLMLVDHGLRCGELAALQVANFDIERGRFTFYREKVDKTQTHVMTARVWAAVLTYLQKDRPTTTLLLGSMKSGVLSGTMGTRSINTRVRALGEQIGVMGLSPHDLRHDWATRAAKKTPIAALAEAGGWSSHEMPFKYISQGANANEGVILDD